MMPPITAEALLWPNLIDVGQSLEPRLDKDVSPDYPTRRHLDEVLSMGNKTGRNQPCPCGSGKKYKRCCLGKTEPSVPTPTSEFTRFPGAEPFYAPGTETDWVAVEGPLDRLSNRVVRLVDQGRLDEAEEAWEELNREYPDEIDSIERKAIILEARGRKLEAAAQYRRAAEYAQTHPGFETADLFLECATRLEEEAGSPQSSENSPPA
jgi:tetratricopeptide (TPR) repeat protein